MTKKRLLLITFIFLLLITSLRLSWMTYHALPEHPSAKQGVLDLREWELTNERPITLDGEWEFFPFQLVSPSALSQAEMSYIQVPSAWEQAFPPEASKEYYYGTYRLRILLNKQLEQPFGLQVSSISTAADIYVNGQLLKKSGHPTAQVEEYKAENTPYILSFTPDTNELELIIQVANPGYNKNGGINNSIKFGNAAAVNKHVNFSTNMQLLVMVVILLHGIYALMIYFFIPRQKGLIFFPILVICLVLSLLVTDNKLLLVWLPLKYEWGIKLTYLSFIGISVCLLRLSHYLVEKEKSFKVIKYLLTLYGLCILFLLFAPLHYVEPVTGLFMLLNFFSFLLLTLFALGAVLNGGEGIIYLFLVAVSNWANTIWGILKEMGLIEFTMYYPLDYILAFLGLAAFWFKRFFQTTAKAEQLAFELQKADKQKDEFLINVSHELRNPLHGMINIAQNTLNVHKDTLNKRNIEDLSLLITVGQRMSLLLNDLLDVTRLKESRISLQVNAVHLPTVATGVFDMLRFMKENKPIQFVTDIPDSFPPILADENRLIQIFFNLLHNAVKYTEEGSITVSATVNDGLAHIHITDTGIGMDIEVQQRIFYPYEQGDSSIATASGGIGIGLSVCKQLVELHGGTLTVSSAPNQGSVFTFTIPLASEVKQDYHVPVHQVGDSINSTSATDWTEVAVTTSSPSWSVEHATSSAYRAKILAVDDDPVNLKILENMLLIEGYEVVSVTSGKEAIAKLDSNEWDLVIADVMMPHMSGYHLAQLIRKRYSAYELPILLLTARSRPEDVEVGFLSGANDYVTKPVDALEIKSRVRALTELKYAVQKRLHLEAAWLQAQIKPHFLFNTLNTVAALSEINITKMNTLLGQLANYLRKSFALDNLAPLVTLEQELELVRSYLFIEQERFEERLQVQWNIENQTNLQLPPFSIQVLVENAIKHGILKRLQGGTVTLHIYEDAKEATIAVSDDGVGMDKEKVEYILSGSPDKTGGIGLYNLDRRLMQLYNQGIQIESSPNQGTTVSFHIPINRE